VEKARDLFFAGAAAFAQLRDAEQRNTVLLRRQTLRREDAKRGGQAPIKTDLLDPQVHYQKGRALWDEGKLPAAIKSLQFAADCDPQNPLYRAEVAYCRYLDSAGGADKALSELGQALRIDPRCGLALYYRGEIERQQGDYDTAEASLRQAAKAMAPDRRPIEALRAMAAERKR
jgi:tetratricopeptide (TPR) repeat protein